MNHPKLLLYIEMPKGGGAYNWLNLPSLLINFPVENEKCTRMSLTPNIIMCYSIVLLLLLSYLYCYSCRYESLTKKNVNICVFALFFY